MHKSQTAIQKSTIDTDTKVGNPTQHQAEQIHRRIKRDLY